MDMRVQMSLICNAWTRACVHVYLLMVVILVSSKS